MYKDKPHYTIKQFENTSQKPKAVWRNLPTLSIDGYSLRPLQKEDVDAWFAYLSLHQVKEHTSWDVKSPHDLLGLIAKYNHANVDASIRFAIVHDLHQRMIGSIGFHSVSDMNKTAEIAYDLHPDFWNKGIMTHCCEVLLQWGFQERGFVRIQATVLPENGASINVLKRCGLTLEGRLRQLKKVRGVSKDFLMFSKIAK
jgi:ribosomal-protein-alanine N-acetyltransferase